MRSLYMYASVSRSNRPVPTATETLTSCMSMSWQLSLRYTLDCLVAGEDAPFSRRRHLALTSAAVFSSLAVALAFPDAAEKILAITGATAVAAVCYLIPVALHFIQRRQAHAAVGPGPLLAALALVTGR